MHPQLVIILRTYHGLNVGYLLPHTLQLALEQVAQLDWCHHLACAVDELYHDDALVFQVLVELVVLFFQCGDFVVFHDFLVLLQVVVVNVSLHEEVLDLECVHFLLVFQQFHWQDVLFLCYKTCWVAFLEYAHLWQKDPNLSVHLVDAEELREELGQEFFLLPHCLLGFQVSKLCFPDDFHLVEDYFLAQGTLATLVVKLMSDFLLEDAHWGECAMRMITWLVDYASELGHG